MTEVTDILSVDWDVPRKLYPAKVLTLATGEKMVVREASREEVPQLLRAIRPLLDAPSEFYDLVAARTFAELLGWHRYRVRNEYCLVGVVDGKLVGLVNNRMFNKDLCISLHTIAIRRGRSIGAHLFAAKQEHAIEYLGAKEIFVTAESPRGFDRWMIEWSLESRPDVQHELGGAKAWVLTRENYYKNKHRQVFGDRPVPDDLYKQSLHFEIIEPDIMRGESD